MGAQTPDGTAAPDQRAACGCVAGTMARAREGPVSAGAGMQRPARRGLEEAYLFPLRPRPLLPIAIWGVCGRSWMQNGMGVGKQGSLAEVDHVADRPSGALGELCSLGELPGGRGFGTGLAYF